MSNAMTNNSHCKVPQYLRKRKLAFIRAKILARKYGYLFYRNAVSHILMSTSQKHYKNCLLWKAFQTLKTHWFIAKAQWRLALRADIHHRYALKRNCLLNWKYAVIIKRERALKMQIAASHYNRKLRRRCFVRLKRLRSYNEKYLLLANSIFKYAILLFLYKNFMIMFYERYELQMEYYSLILYYEGFNKRILKRYFKNIILHKEVRTVKRNNIRLVRLFRKIKYRPKQLLIYFQCWQNFTQASVIERLKRQIAEKHLGNKLLAVCWSKLYSYKVYRHTKIGNYEKAANFYSDLLKRRALRGLNHYYFNKAELKFKTTQICELYKRKLKARCLLGLRIYRADRLRKKETVAVMRKISNLRLLKRSFSTLKNYCEDCKIKRNKIRIAQKFNYAFLLRTYFTSLKYYVQRKLHKRTIREELIATASRIRQQRLLQTIFQKWKRHNFDVQEKMRKLKQLNKTFTDNLRKKVFLVWKSFITQKQIRKLVHQKALNHCIKLLLKNSFISWKCFVEEEKKYQTLLKEANKAFDDSLLREGIAVILWAAAEKRRFKQKIILQKFWREFVLASKYFKIWRSRTLLPSQSHNYHYKNTTYFKWNPLCFESPHVPQYLNVKL